MIGRSRQKVKLNFTSLFLCNFLTNETPSTEIYTLSLHDALPIFLEQLSIELQELARVSRASIRDDKADVEIFRTFGERDDEADRKSTRLNSSHMSISYAVFCLKKKKMVLIKMLKQYYFLQLTNRS